MNLKSTAKAFLGHFGYEVRRVQDPHSKSFPLGRDPFPDMWKLTSARARPVVFDVGANVGQSIVKFRKHFSDPVIHAFEPGPDTFKELQDRTAGIPDLHLNNVALGASSGKMNLFESITGSQLNSLLEPSTEIWGGGGVKGKTQVEVSTVDAYCRDKDIDRIDILKTDAQGFDFEVIKGAVGMLQKKSVQLVFMEILFSDMYKGQARMDEIYGFLMDNGFILVSFYPFYYWADKASWTEAVFIQPDYKSTTVI